MAWIAFDDTDSRGAGCTTHLAFRAVARLGGLDLIGPPELVRLNPNVPFKTRGNGALCLRVGHGVGAPRRIGRAEDGSDLFCYTDGESPSAGELTSAFEGVRGLIQSERQRAEGTEPGLAAGFHAPPETFYWSAVQSILPRSSGLATAEAYAAHVAGWEGGRGLLGAMAAAAWCGSHDATYEAIAYRRPERVGRPRGIEESAVAAVDDRFPSCFDSWDPQYRVARAIPASPCPVLFGIRGERPDAALRAAQSLGPEEPEGLLAFRTNQATDDHLAMDGEAGWAPYSSGVFSARVVGSPSVVAGGHAFVPVASDGRRLVAAAFEPTKGFRAAVRLLRPDDAVVLAGAFHADVETLALEKMAVVEAPPENRLLKPACRRCGATMRSRGRGAGFRCRRCGARAPAAAARVEPTERSEVLGAYEVPVCARRHLAKPLSREGFPTR